MTNVQRNDTEERREKILRHMRVLVPFWRPLSPEEQAAEWRKTREFLDLLSEEDVRRALRRLEGIEHPPALVWELLIATPPVLRLVLYAFHPRRSDPATWHRLRPYADSMEMNFLRNIGPVLEEHGVGLEWTTLLLAVYHAVRYAQDSKDSGDPRTFGACVREFRQCCIEPTRSETSEGVVETERMPLVGGGSLTVHYLTRPDGTQHEELIFDFAHGEGNEDTFREMVDRMVLRRIQQFGHRRHFRDGWFSEATGVTRVAKLAQNGKVIFERPLHLEETYRGLAANVVFQHPLGHMPYEDVKQEAHAALYAAALDYRQDFLVPGFLQTHMNGALSDRYRSADVSHVQNGERRPADETEISTEPELLREQQEDSYIPEAGVRAIPTPERDAANREWYALLDRLPPRQRELADLLLQGHTRAEAADALGVSRARVTQMLRKMPSVIGDVLRWLADRAR